MNTPVDVISDPRPTPFCGTAPRSSQLDVSAHRSHRRPATQDDCMGLVTQMAGNQPDVGRQRLLLRASQQILQHLDPWAEVADHNSRDVRLSVMEQVG